MGAKNAPSGAGGRGLERAAAVRQLGVRSVHVVRAGRALALVRQPAAGDAAAVEHRHRAGRPPRRELPVVFLGAALGRCVDRPRLRVAQRRLAALGALGPQRRVEGVGLFRGRVLDDAAALVALAEGRRRAGAVEDVLMRAARDELAGVAVALGAADAAAVAKPEAGLAEGSSEVARVFARSLGRRMRAPVRVVCARQLG